MTTEKSRSGLYGDGPDLGDPDDEWIFFTVDLTDGTYSNYFNPMVQGMSKITNTGLPFFGFDVRDNIIIPLELILVET